MKLATILGLTGALILGLAAQVGAQSKELTLVGYGVAKPVYAKIIPAFKKHWKEKTGQDVTFKESYGGSGAQSRAVIGGLEADILIQNLDAYVDQLVDAGLVNADWSTRLPHNAAPVTSVIVLVTREGNPKNITTWSDLVKDGIEIVALNPKTSGNARWGLVAGYASLNEGDSTANGESFIRQFIRNTKSLSNNGREATDAFVRNGVGDVLLTFENEAKFANKASGESLHYVAPETNIRVDFPVTIVDKNVDKHGTREVSEAFVQFLFTPEAQEIYAEAGYRPNDKAVFDRHADQFEKVTKLFTVEELGGWKAVNAKLFDDGAFYDQASAEKK